MKPRILFALLATGTCFYAGPLPAASTYHYTPGGKNALKFEFVQADAKTPGSFRDYDVTLTLDDKNPTASKLTVRVKVASLDTQDEERDGILRGEDLFDSQRHPVATFTSMRIVRAQAGYEAQGKLTIRDVTRDVSVPFALRNGHMTGATTLRRLDFGIGKGEFESTEWVGNDVKVTFDLRPSSSSAESRKPKAKSPQ